MSRGQSTETFKTASGENAANFGSARNALGAAENGITGYQSQLAKFVSGNPYTAGGEYDQTIDKGLTDLSKAGANSLKGALQAQSLRTGQNSAANAATAASAARRNTRDLAGSLASAQQQRIGNEAGYNQAALRASAVPEQMASGLYGEAGRQADDELDSEEGAGRQPGFWDQLGGSFAGAAGRTLGA